MKTLVRNKIHQSDKSHDMLLGEYNHKKVKMTYRAYNANETFEVELFDDDKWNHIFSMADLGKSSDSSIFITNEIKREDRANMLISLSKKHLELLLS